MDDLKIDTLHGNVVTGDVTIHNHHTHHHRHTHHHTVHAHGPVHVHHHAVSEFALQAPPAPPARATKRPRPAHDLSAAQKEVLTLMRPLPKHMRVAVLNFMRIEFGTGLVMELEPRELNRLRAHVLDARRAAGI